MSLTRRTFLASAACCIPAPWAAGQTRTIVDIHQHTPYSGRSADQLVAHQKRMGVTKTVLLPAGSRFGLAAQAGGNEVVRDLMRRHPGEYAVFANELPNVPQTRETIEKYLKLGAIGIGEQKFPVECDSKHMDLIAEIAREYDVPVLMHFEFGRYNIGFERFHKMLERHPRVNFIGHAQTWWGNIDRDHDQTVMYPRTKVTPGGITDRLLSDYPNIFGDLSAGSGRNSIQRDEDHARGFLDRHQDKLLFGSDCSDPGGAGPNCIGTATLELLQRLAPDERALGKILHGNAQRIMRI